MTRAVLRTMLVSVASKKIRIPTTGLDTLLSPEYELYGGARVERVGGGISQGNSLRRR